MKLNTKLFVWVVLLIQFGIIAFLFARDRSNTRLITELIRGELVAETSNYNLYLQKLARGDLESVSQIMRARVLTNVAMLHSGRYGILDHDQEQAVKTVLSQQIP
jgi:enhancing lycopene biosynthesis protein 2